MVIRLLLISLSLGLTLSLIGKTLRNGQVRTQRLTKLILRDTENSRRGFSEDGRNRRTNIDIQFVDANEVKILRNSLGASFITKIKSFSSDRDFTQFLKSTAQKRIAVTQADKQSIIDELLHRVPKMSVHSACDVLWSLGTLKLPLRQMVNAAYILYHSYFCAVPTS